jgi:hypothetical protein
VSAAGCISREDAPLVAASVACFASFFAYGAISSSLGAALPSFSKELQSGLAFSLRGAGFFIGTMVSATAASDTSFPVSKDTLTALCILLSGAVTGLIVLSSNYYLTLFLYGVQGAGFGGIDTFANCALPELWGSRAQPWMQALHAFFGVGAIIGPALVGSLGYETAFVLIFLMSGVPILGLLLYNARASLALLAFRGLGGTHANAQKSENSDDSATTYEDEDIDVIDISVNPLDDDAPSSPKQSPNDQPPLLPTFLKWHITVFYFIYSGMEAAYAGMSSLSHSFMIIPYHSFLICAPSLPYSSV